MTSFAELVDEGLIRERVDLAPFTTYKFGGPARYLAEPGNEQELRAVAEAWDGPVFVLGRGSNVVISERGFDGLVLIPSMHHLDLHHEGLVTAGAGVPQPVVARRAAAVGLGGLEFMVGIPGSIGGAVAMNAGCHGTETGDVLVTARIFDVGRAEASDRTPDELEMRYRHSNVGAGQVVVEATLRTVPTSPDEAERKIREITRWRRDHQPGGTLNAGSVFKNPEGDAAGRIIDEAGLKGFRIGGACVSERHANFFVADEGATPRHVHALVDEVTRRVHDATGITLEPEIRFVGDFDS
jgi:UDP-N-acetylmuramate dehydrogenase